MGIGRRITGIISNSNNNSAVCGCNTLGCAMDFMVYSRDFIDKIYAQSFRRGTGIGIHLTII